MRSMIIAMLLPAVLLATTIVQSGKDYQWSEIGEVFDLDEVSSSDVTGIELWWSFADENSLWVYAQNSTTLLHHSDLSNISGIGAIDEYIFSDKIATPLEEGDILLLKNSATDGYGAIKIDEILSSQRQVNITWHLLGKDENYRYAMNPLDGKCNIFAATDTLPKNWSACDQEDYEQERVRDSLSGELDKAYVDSRPSGWSLLGTCNDITDPSLFEADHTVWQYDFDNNEWYLADTSGSEDSHFRIRAFSGFWLVK